MMFVDLIFHPLIGTWLVSIIALLGGWMMYAELNRKLPARWVRLACILLITLALICVVIRPAINRQALPEEALLLTKQFSKSFADSVRRRNPKMTVYRTADAEPYPNSIVLDDYQKLENSNYTIIGSGLAAGELAHLIRKPVAFTPPRGAKKGLMTLTVGKFYANQTNTIIGTFRTGDKNASIVLKGPIGILDSISISDLNTERAFALKFSVPISGQYLLDLIIDDGDSKRTETLPLNILPAMPMDVLMLQNTASPEINFLKRFLGERGNHVVTRSHISRTAYKFEFDNSEEINVNRLTPESLTRFDIIITDDASLKELSTPEMKALRTSITNGGGLLIVGSPDFFPDLTLSTHQDKNIANVTLSQNKSVALNVKGQLTPGPEWTSVLRAHSIGFISGYQMSGNGHAGLTLVENSYTLALKGDTSAYAAIWSPLISRIARKKSSGFETRMRTPFPQITNETVEFDVITSGKDPEITFEGARIPMKEDVVVDDLWHGRLWPSSDGWHSIVVGDSIDTFHFYSFSEERWSGLVEQNQIKENRLSVKKQDNDLRPLTSVEQPIPQLIFYLIFLIAAAILWLIPKL